MLRRSLIATTERRRERWLSRLPSKVTGGTDRTFMSFSTSEPSRGGWQFVTPPSSKQRILLGCTAYDPSVGTIWDGIKAHLNSAKGGQLNFDYVLFTNYEAQVAALLSGQIDVAWNGPISHVMAEDLALSAQEDGHDIPLVQSVGMRDVDRDFRTVALVRKDAAGAADSSKKALASQTIATGSTDSPQGHIVPVDWLRHTLGIHNSTIVPHEAHLGKHGDTAVGEIRALQALLDGTDGTSAALVSEMMYRRGLAGGLKDSGIDPKELSECVIQLTESPPVFDHCSFDALIGHHPREQSQSLAPTSASLDAHRQKIYAFSRSILAMDMNDPCQAPIMTMEGIDRKWMGPRIDPGGAVRGALHRLGLAKSNSAFAASTDNNFQQKRAFSSSSNTGTGEKVAVVGAGVAGLQTIRALRAKGFDVTAFDANDGVGGLWRENYLSYGVQVPKQLYEFPDLPFDEVRFGDYPTGAQVRRYIERYTDHFRLGDSIRLNTRLTKATQRNDGKWTIQTIMDGKDEETHDFDKLVIATGLYSSHRPSLPRSASEAKASGIFKGEILHSNEMRRAEQVSGKKVLVIGNGKSAVDVAVASSDAGAEAVTMLSRHPHWPTPRKIAGLIPFQYVFLSRLGQNLVLGLTGPLPKCSPPHSSIWHSVGKYVMPPIFKVVELLFAAQFRNVTGPTSPFLKVGVVEDFYGYAQVLNYNFRDKVKSGEIVWRMDQIQNFEPDGTILTGNGDKVDADVVICGTGFQKDYGMFDDETKSKLNVESDGLYLFNHTIPTNVDNLAFVGAELAVISNITGYALQAGWLSKYWSGEVNSGGKQAIEDEVTALKEWKRSWMPDTPSRASLVLLHQIHFYDRLMKDMGMEKKRKSNPLSEWFMPYESSDYNGVLTALEEEGTASAALRSEIHSTLPGKV